MLSDSDRVLIESLVAQDSPQELGVFYADEVPDGVSEEGFRFLMELCQFRIYQSNPSSMLDEAGATSRVAWKYALRVGLEWPDSIGRRQRHFGQRATSVTDSGKSTIVSTPDVREIKHGCRRAKRSRWTTSLST